MQLLQEVDKPGSDVEEYARSLDNILGEKMEAITSLRRRVADFLYHIKQEKELSAKFLEQQNEIKDVFDLRDSLDKEGKNNQESPLLIDDLDNPMSN